MDNNNQLVKCVYIRSHTMSPWTCMCVGRALGMSVIILMSMFTWMLCEAKVIKHVKIFTNKVSILKISFYSKPLLYRSCLITYNFLSVSHALFNIYLIIITSTTEINCKVKLSYRNIELLSKWKEYLNLSATVGASINSENPQSIREWVQNIKRSPWILLWIERNELQICNDMDGSSNMIHSQWKETDTKPYTAWTQLFVLSRVERKVTCGVELDQWLLMEGVGRCMKEFLGWG